jgi:hypothetical protein
MLERHLGAVKISVASLRHLAKTGKTYRGKIHKALGRIE